MERAAPLLDYIASANARDAGLKQVTDNNANWMSLALLQLEQFARNRDGWANTEHGVTGEDIRLMLVVHVGNPGSSNAWGALIRQAITRGLLVASGAYRPMKDVTSHARKTAVYSLVRPK